MRWPLSVIQSGSHTLSGLVSWWSSKDTTVCNHPAISPCNPLQSTSNNPLLMTSVFKPMLFGRQTIIHNVDKATYVTEPKYSHITVTTSKQSWLKSSTHIGRAIRWRFPTTSLLLILINFIFVDVRSCLSSSKDRGGYVLVWGKPITHGKWLDCPHPISSLPFPSILPAPKSGH